MRTARLRFTIMYVALFMLSGVALLGLTSFLTIARSTSPVVPAQQQRPDASAARIAELEARLEAVHRDQARQLLGGSAIALAVMGVASVLLGRSVAGRVLRPLRTITAATRRITADNLHERLATPGPGDEVKALADTIDELLERLEQAFAAQRRFVANASHELRTPLATMRASLDVAVAKPGPVPPQTVALAGRLRTELDRVDGLLDGFLTLARIQHGALADREPVSVGALVTEVVSARAADIEAKRLTVRADVRPDAWTRGNAVLLAQMTGNVIDNAITHNVPDGSVRVVAAPEAGTALLAVETGGPPLDPEQVARLGQPFQRLGLERTAGGGTGLGLSIVAAIAAAHGGTLVLRARPEGGLHVAIRLPLIPPASREDEAA
ncbi:HAMP domain-containing histidine kinase [Plantactinospora sp. S1510]|uniref:histidine kinase n=1 Tax=Plantactinospora alkalitolerans TaxID=2789879 RepID=A0ABS0GSA4_9ACTN|nr:HAMP domain-containing sensor histidine kinase [Plantactinospora alkalitolerans]MBF9129081.1 HAMP domain-containing histidine kinase [Plantactinospora alkalitolerans]